MASESSTVAKDEKNVSSFVDSSSQRRKTSFLMAQAGLRILVVAFTLVAISVTVANRQSVVIFGLNFQARYSYSSALTFLVASDAVLCSFSALSLVFIYILSRSGTTSPLKKYFFLFLLDTVMMVLIIAGCAAATAIGYLGKYGEEQMTWHATCGYVSKFCNRMSISLAFSYLAFFACLLLNLMSAHALIYRPIIKN
ncbi:putative casparian strip membrane protein [Rosa chinensis]|uniref:CASP-like protein n=1 Tax=Rosa chinensis TaxID=74649 RepID=A0A2P6S6M8_ROSCH|nr:CASP-like protein 1F2 [Rosa chinensis]PRQ54328.1 putative casparian strip membrane protein [Rosa chinensis]